MFYSNPRILPLALLLPVVSAHVSAEVDTEQRHEMVITATRTALPFQDVIGDVTVIDNAALQRYRGESVLAALQGQAGIQMASNGGAGKVSSIFLRGANSAHTLVLIDGVRYGSVTLGTPALEHLPVEQIERVEILRGAAASLYGSDAIGGVIQIFTRQAGKTPKMSLTVGAGTQNSQQASLSASGQQNDTRAALVLAHSKTDGINAISNVNNSSFFNDKDGYENNSLGLNVQQHLSQGHDVGVRLLLAQSKNQYDSAAYDANFSPVAQNYNYRNHSKNGAFSLWSSHQFNQQWRARLQIGRGVDDSDSYEPQSASNYSAKISHFKTTQDQISLQNEFTLAQGTLNFNAELLKQSVDSTTPYAVNERRIQSAMLGYVAQYGATGVQTNLRHDQNSQYGGETTYSLGVSRALNEQITLGAVSGTAFVAPSFNNLYFPFYGSDQLVPETSRSNELYASLNVANFSSRLTVYQNRVKNLIQYNPATSGPDNVGLVRLQGITLNNQWLGKTAQAGLVYDYLDAENRAKGSNHGNQLVLRARHTGTAYVGAQQGLFAGRVEVQAAGTRYDDAANKNRLAGYTLVNLSGSVQVTPELLIGLRVNNLFNENYESTKDYGTLGLNGLLSLSYTPRF